MAIWTPIQNLPTGAHTTTLEYDEKAIFHFMPNHGREWDEQLESSNVMYSDMVGTLLKKWS